MVFNRASLVVIFSIKVNVLNCNQAWEQAFGVKMGGGRGSLCGQRALLESQCDCPGGTPVNYHTGTRPSRLGDKPHDWFHLRWSCCSNLKSIELTNERHIELPN